jgi:hypothetical protein
MPANEKAYPSQANLRHRTAIVRLPDAHPKLAEEPVDMKEGVPGFMAA